MLIQHGCYETIRVAYCFYQRSVSYTKRKSQIITGYNGL
nr:MAG TPA: hypothetical protein [Caudoviricetes sp.]